MKTHDRVSVLYQLALSVNHSADVHTNARHFVQNLRRAMGLRSVSIWKKSGPGYGLVAAQPAVGPTADVETQLPLSFQDLVSESEYALTVGLQDPLLSSESDDRWALVNLKSFGLLLMSTRDPNVDVVQEVVKPCLPIFRSLGLALAAIQDRQNLQIEVESREKI